MLDVPAATGLRAGTQPRRRARAPARGVASRLDPPAIAAWTLAFAVVASLALRNGGYDTVVRSEVGVAVWWVVLLGALAGILPGRIGAAGWVAIGLLAGFAVWTGVAIGWSESAGRTSVELGRVAAYLGVLVLAVALQGRTAARHTVNGVACAIGLVSVLAVLSRLHPQAFPANDQLEFLGSGSATKLSYPLNYWNALAALAAIGVPLLLGVAVGARTLAGRAAAAATLPLSGLCLYLTISRGGALAAAIGIAAFLVLVPRRLGALATLLVSGAAAALLVSATAQRDALQGGVPSATALAEGTEVLWLALIVCACAALAQVGLGLVARHIRRPAVLAPGRRATALGALGLLAVTAAVAVAAGAPGEVGDRWRDFKAPAGAVAAGDQDNLFSRLQATNGNGRYQYWQSAVDAGATDPWRGIGPGTFEFWWSRHATTPGFIRDAHSLYFETLGETGIVGLALLAGLLLWLLLNAALRCLRASGELRVWIAAAAGGVAAFMTAAMFEWVWEMAAIAMAAMALGAVVVAGRDDAAPPSAAERRPASRAILAVLALAALAAILVPLAAAVAIRDSRDAAADGRLTAALEASRTAERLQPYAAMPHLQRALLLEAVGERERAAAAARAATVREPTNWRTWLVLSRLDARRGAAAPARDALRTARRLNPRSPLLAPR